MAAVNKSYKQSGDNNIIQKIYAWIIDKISGDKEPKEKASISSDPAREYYERQQIRQQARDRIDQVKNNAIRNW